VVEYETFIKMNTCVYIVTSSLPYSLP